MNEPLVAKDWLAFHIFYASDANPVRPGSPSASTLTAPARPGCPPASVFSTTCWTRSPATG